VAHRAALLGVIGTLVGLLLGWGLAQGIVRLLIAWQRLEWEQLSAFDVGLDWRADGWLGVAITSALWPARRASQVSPLARFIRTARAAPIRLCPGRARGMVLLIAVIAVRRLDGRDTRSAHAGLWPVMVLCIFMALMTLAGGLLLLPPLVAGLTAGCAGCFRIAGRRRAIGGRPTRARRSRTMLTTGTLAVGVAMIILFERHRRL